MKTRFAPSPTGHLHIGSARTALFNYLLARHSGGQFLLRIEDTDRARHIEDAVGQVIEDLHWLGLRWDEGIEVGGPAGSYRQSDRLELYQKRAEQLLAAGQAYYAFETPEELDALRLAAEAKKQTFRYQRPATLPTAADAERARAAGRPVVVRFRCPGHDVAIHDEVYGDVTVPADQQDDFIILKADGWATYHLANVVDDALMGITFILRGQEFLGQTWRHVLLREALGFPEPHYAHLPLIVDAQGRKLSKREGAVDVFSFRQAGYLPEAIINFIGLLGWAPAGGEREKFTLNELAEAFSVQRINKANAYFDRDKLIAFNTVAIAAASPERLLAAFKDFITINETPFTGLDDATLARVLAVCAGFRTFADVVTKAGALFVADEAIYYDEKAVKKVLARNNGEGFAMLEKLRPLLEKCIWDQGNIHHLLNDQAKMTIVWPPTDAIPPMAKVAQPLRVALTGATVSPVIEETLFLLGREKTLARIDRCLRLLRT
jgi:glutamyl-tRNA synthetase